MTCRNNTGFWDALDALLQQSKAVIDRPKGTAHPRYPHVRYPADYGYLAGTASMDGDGIDLWRGSAGNERIGAVICTVDLMMRDSEIKLLIGCTKEETERIYAFHNETEYMKGLLIQR